MPIDQADVRDRLQHELTSLDHQLADLGVDPATESMLPREDEGFADSAHATAERAERISLVEELALARREVAAALGRIEAGTYGHCERCGRPIPPERLEARPTARLCVECKRATT